MIKYSQDRNTLGDNTMNNDNPILNDYVFKQVFGKQENERILISFLNAMLNGDYNIKSAKVINTEIPRFSEESKTILLDVQVQTDDGSYIDIEVQRSYKPDLIDRMFVYGANMITRYSEKSTGFNNTKCIAIWILDCNMTDFKMFGNDPIIGEFNFRSMIDGSKYLPLEGLKIYPIELRKGTDIENISSYKETWINFLKTSNDESKPEEIEEIHEAYEKVRYTTGSREYVSYMDAYNKAEQLRRNDLLHATNDALKQGLTKGRAEGLAEGKKVGEHKKAIETARNFLKMGLSVEQVAQGTGLTVDEVKNL